MSETLDEWGKRWNKKTRTEVVFDPRDEELDPGVIPLEIPAVDQLLGGGFPRGLTTILVGEPSSGKTLLSQLVIASAQRQGGTAVFFDIERSYHERWFRLTGVDTSPEKLRVVRPRNLEQAFDMVCDILEKVRPDVVVVDSIPALVPKAMLTAEMDKSDFRGVSARKVTEGIAKVTQYNRSTALIFINQLRVSMGVKFGNPESMPGGKALRFYSSLLVRVRRGKWLTDAEVDADELDFTDVDEKDAKRIGFMLKLRTEKSRLAPPFQECELRFTFDGAVDWVGSLVHLALTRGVIGQPSTGYFTLPGEEAKVHGRIALEERIREDGELRAKLVGLVKS